MGMKDQEAKFFREFRVALEKSKSIPRKCLS